MAKITELAKKYTALKQRVLRMEAELQIAEAKAYIEADKENPDKSETWKRNKARSEVAPLMNKLASERGALEEARIMLIVSGGLQECV